MRGTGLRRSAVSTALATMILLVLACLLPPVSRAEAPESAVGTFGGCLNKQRKGDLMLLFDESKSLQTSDPANQRVLAAHYLITRLNESATRSKLDLSIALAAFSDDFHSVLDWTKLDDGAGTTAVQSGVDEFAKRNQGVQTDYWNGLNGARSDLAKRRTPSDPNRCQAIVWFSDGQFSVHLKPEAYEQNESARTKVYAPDVGDLRERADSDEAERLAVESLCAPKGLADQVRVAKITLFGVGLKPKVNEEPNESDFDTMRRVATGKDTGGEANCGSRLRPVPGSFTPVDDISDLLFALKEIFEKGDVTRGNVCQLADPEKCRSQGHRFVLDESVTRVDILASSDVDNTQAYLLPPGGGPVELKREAGSSPLATWKWEEARTLAVKLDNADHTARDWEGEWSLVFLDPKTSGTSKASISISGNIFPAWRESDTTKLYTGEIARLKFGLRDDRDQDVGPSSIKGTGTFNAELERPNSDPIAIVDDLPVQELSNQNDASLDLTKIPPGPATLKLTLDLTTKGVEGRPGTRLTPQVLDFDLNILPPRGAPPLGSLINFGSITGTADKTATLTATGPGCVWLESGAQPQIDALPNGDVGTVSITSEKQAAGSCLKLADGQSEELPLRLETANGGNGTLAGLVPITVVGPGAQDKPTVVQVPFTADLQKPLNAGTFSLAFIGAMVLGVGIPLLLLALTKWFTAKIPGQTLVAQEIPVRVEGGQVLRDGSPLDLRDSDFTEMVPLGAQGSRTAQAGSFALRTHTGWSPFGAGYVLAEAPGQVGVSSEHPKPYGRTQAARLPLAVHNTWVAARAPGAAAGSATVLILSSLDPTGEGRRQLVDAIRSRLPGLMSELGDTAPSAGSGSADPFGGSGPAAPTVDPFADFNSGGWSDPFTAPTSTTPAGPAGPPPRPSRPPAGAAEPSPWPSEDVGEAAGDTTVIRPGPVQPDPAGQPQRPAGPAAPSQPPPEPAAQPWSFDSAFNDDQGRS